MWIILRLQTSDSKCWKRQKAGQRRWRIMNAEVFFNSRQLFSRCESIIKLGTLADYFATNYWNMPRWSLAQLQIQMPPKLNKQREQFKEMALSPQHSTSSSMRFLLSTRSAMPLLWLILLYIEASHSRMDTIAAASLLFHFYRKGKHYSFHYSHGLPPQISQCAFQSSLQWHRCRRTAPELESNYLFILFNHWNHVWWFEEDWRSVQPHWWDCKPPEQPT